MERKKSVQIRDIIRNFWKDNPELYHHMMEARIQRLWGELFDPSIAQYTTNLYVKNRTLYVSMSSSVVRTEMISKRKHLVSTLNKYAGADVIDDIMIR